MATRQKEPLRPLRPEEYASLERVVRRGSARVDQVRRAQALRAVARGASLTHAARGAGFGSHTAVAKVVARFNQQGVAALTIRSGRGRKQRYDMQARARIVALAQQEPRRREDETATWSLSTLQGALRGQGFPQVGTSTIRRVLQEAGSSYQRTRTWRPTGTVQHTRKNGVVPVADPRTEEKKPDDAGVSPERGGGRQPRVVSR